MIAGCLRELGIFMGEIVSDNHEDPVFLSDDIEILKRIIIARNDKYDNWGWKVPKTMFQIENLLPLIRNPHFIIVTRDPFDIAKSMMKREAMPFDLAIQHIFLVYKHLQQFVEKCLAPLMFVSYNRVLADKEAFICELTSFIGSENLSKEQLNQLRNFIGGNYRSTSLDKKQLASLAKAKIDQTNLNLINQIQQKSTRVLRRCREEINTIEKIQEEMATKQLTRDLQNIHRWEEGLHKIPELRNLIELLDEKIIDKVSYQDITTTEELRKQCETLLTEIILFRYIGDRLLYELNKKQ
ncbi:MAG: hypothetical protein O4808_20810 [Trichodesmium sp. St17_bin3_1_1]|nr:hypothetical protein [Trichodesmium sp. St17_bin3_1_1]